MQISLHICAVWSESSLESFWIAKDAKFLHANKEDSDQTLRMCRLIWVFVRCAYRKVRFLTLLLIHLSISSIASDKALFSAEKYWYFFLFLLENICCGYLLEAPHWGASYEYPQHMFSCRNKKSIIWIPPLIWSYILEDISLQHRTWRMKNQMMWCFMCSCELLIGFLKSIMSTPAIIHSKSKLMWTN